MTWRVLSRALPLKSQLPRTHQARLVVLAIGSAKRFQTHGHWKAQSGIGAVAVNNASAHSERLARAIARPQPDGAMDDAHGMQQQGVLAVALLDGIPCRIENDATDSGVDAFRRVSACLARSYTSWMASRPSGSVTVSRLPWMS